MRKAIYLLALSFLFSACQTPVSPEVSETGDISVDAPQPGDLPADAPTTSGFPGGVFEAQVTGDFTRSIQGEAVFETLYGLSGEPIFWLSLRGLKDDENERHYRLIDFTTGQEHPPIRGAYEFSVFEQGQDSEHADFSASYQDSDVGSNVFKPLGGTFYVYASDEGRVEGRFHFKAYDDVATGPGVFERVEIVISGTLHAIKGDVGVILN